MLRNCPKSQLDRDERARLVALLKFKERSGLSVYKQWLTYTQGYSDTDKLICDIVDQGLVVLLYKYKVVANRTFATYITRYIRWRLAEEVKWHVGSSEDMYVELPCSPDPELRIDLLTLMSKWEQQLAWYIIDDMSVRDIEAITIMPKSTVHWQINKLKEKLCQIVS